MKEKEQSAVKFYYITGIDRDSWGKGIKRKIDEHINLISNFFGVNVEYISLEKKMSKVQKYLRKMNPFDSEFDSEKLDAVPERAIVYMRYILTDCKLIKAYRKMHDRGIRIIAEIPTYPYDGEIQDVLGRLHLMQDKFYRKKLHKYIDRIVTYSKDDVIFEIKTLRISNGVDTNCKMILYERNKDKSAIDMIGVASFAFWHGYDRVIKGMRNYYLKGGNRNLIFHIVGNGKNVLKGYKKMTDDYNLKEHVIFHGVRTGKELDRIYSRCMIGIDALGRHRAGISYNSSLKGKEYLIKGLPIVSGVETELDNMDFKYYLRVPADDSPMEMDDIISFVDKLYDGDDSILHDRIYRFGKKFGYAETFLPVLDFMNSLI
ncbi:MAG: glycosyltransferase [Hungatella sp.]|nr:glycosyltransferase [Hungatella sp.]